MIGADEVREAGRFVDPLGGAHDERHALKIVRQRAAVRQVVHGIGAGDEERLDFAARQLRAQLGKLGIAPLPLIGRARQIDRGAVRADASG